MSRSYFNRRLFIALIVLYSSAFSSIGFAQNKLTGRVPLPDPLTLKRAIELSDQQHPDLELASSRLDHQKANFKKQKSAKGFEVELNITGQQVDPVSSAGGVGDSVTSVLLRKSLYDFGKTGNQIASAKENLEGEWSLYFNARQKRKLDVMRLFFNVLLADLRYRVDNETMARTYVQYDKVRERHKLGQYSDVLLLKHESQYRSALGERVKAQSRRRATRSRLAIGMNRPGDLADNLTAPFLDDQDRKPPSYESVIEKVLKSNPAMVALRHQVKSAEKNLRSARAVRRPTISAELEANQYERAIGMRNDNRASVNLKWPIYRGGLKNASLGKADAKLREQRAIAQRAENLLRQQVLELLQRIEFFQYRAKAAQTFVDYRDLQLDESRALYEMEARATLGDAMIGVTEAQWKAAKVKYDLAFAWAELKALSGELVEKTVTEKYR